MKFMKMDLQKPIYSRDVVKTVTWADFSLFSEEFPLFYEKVEIPEKIISQKTEKPENHENLNFCNTP